MINQDWNQDLAYACAWWSGVPLFDPDTFIKRDEVIKHFVGAHKGSFSNLLVRAYRKDLPNRWEQALKDYEKHTRMCMNLYIDMKEKQGEMFANTNSLSHHEQAKLCGKVLSDYMPVEMEKEYA